MIKYKDNVTPKLAKLALNLPVALDTGVIESLDVSTKAMRRRVETATTPTGYLRSSGGKPRYKPRPAWFLGRGPGRIESGKMINSIRWQMTSRGGQQVRAIGGFINAPRYTALQEEGNGRIEPMLAFAKGHTIMSSRFDATMTKYVEQALRAANNNRVMPRRY